ncbi:MAG TPA: PIN domain-containing protein [Blastocatellia bacterium]|nr:PIN domain-containing protein [Blastocatellia bacterium]
MNRPIILDAGPLGRIAHPRPNKDIALWLKQILTAGVEVIIPEISDYEVRRNLLLTGLNKSVERLDLLNKSLVYLPLNTRVMLKAAELWAEARKSGQPTADPKALDGDVILAAQAMEVGAIVATENIGHLSRFIEAKHWRDITLEDVMPSVHEFDIEYPAEDFLEDLREIAKVGTSNIIDFPKSFEVVDEAGKVEHFRVNTRHAFYPIANYCVQRYGTEIGTARAWRLKEVIVHLRKFQKLLTEKGLLTTAPSHFKIDDDLLEYLLKAPLQKDDGRIPENTIQTYVENKETE